MTVSLNPNPEPISNCGLSQNTETITARDSAKTLHFESGNAATTKSKAHDVDPNSLEDAESPHSLTPARDRVVVLRPHSVSIKDPLRGLCWLISQIAIDSVQGF